MASRRSVSSPRRASESGVGRGGPRKSISLPRPMYASVVSYGFYCLIKCLI